MKKYIIALLSLCIAVTGINASIWSNIKDEAKGKWERFKDDPKASLQRGQEKAQGYVDAADKAVKTGQDLYDKYGVTVFGEEGDTGTLADVGVITGQALGAAGTATAGVSGLLGTKKDDDKTETDANE